MEQPRDPEVSSLDAFELPSTWSYVGTTTALQHRFPDRANTWIIDTYNWPKHGAIVHISILMNVLGCCVTLGMHIDLVSAQFLLWLTIGAVFAFLFALVLIWLWAQRHPVVWRTRLNKRVQDYDAAAASTYWRSHFKALYGFALLAVTFLSVVGWRNEVDAEKKRSEDEQARTKEKTLMEELSSLKHLADQELVKGIVDDEWTFRGRAAEEIREFFTDDAFISLAKTRSLRGVEQPAEFHEGVARVLKYYDNKLIDDNLYWKIVKKIRVSDDGYRVLVWTNTKWRSSSSPMWVPRYDQVWQFEKQILKTVTNGEEAYPEKWRIRQFSGGLSDKEAEVRFEELHTGLDSAAEWQRIFEVQRSAAKNAASVPLP